MAHRAMTGFAMEKYMTNIRSGIGAVLAASVLIVGLSACEKKEGPAERAGKAVDNAVETAGKKIEKAGEKIQDAAKDDKK
jgi:predicted small secreted protein